jgi:CBS domain-containing protein
MAKSPKGHTVLDVSQYEHGEVAMGILDKAKETAERVREQATRGVEAGRTRAAEVQARRQQARLLQNLGAAYYAENRGKGDRAAVERALADLDTYAQAHPDANLTAVESVRQARDIMHPGAECIGENESLATAAQKMRDLGVGSLPICGDDDRLHGILTDRDIVVRCLAEGRDPAQMKAAECAQGTLFWVDADATVDEALRQMEDHKVKRLPVIENHRLVGLISEADLARNLTEHRLAEFVEKVYGTR